MIDDYRRSETRCPNDRFAPGLADEKNTAKQRSAFGDGAEL